MKIDIACPAPPGSRTGNRVTAERWARLLRRLGHRVRVVHDGNVGPANLLVALHATRSAEAIVRFREMCPAAPFLVAISGTDLYRDLARGRGSWRALEQASRLVVLNPLVVEDLPGELRAKTRVILQSAVPPRRRSRPTGRYFDVAVVGHLRQVKDPFRAEEAVRDVPASSRLRVRHVGRGLEAGIEEDARRRAASNPRYVWLGGRPGSATHREIARAHLLVLSSRFEGGSNVISEAVVCGVPVLSSRISCAEGLLGRNYPGFFPVGDTAALRELLLRAESEPLFRRRLERRCRSRRGLFTPAREQRAWRSLLAELRSACISQS